MIAKFKKFAANLEQIRSAFGVKAAFESIVDRLGSATVGLQVIDVVWLDSAQVDDLSDRDPRFDFRFLSPEEIRHYAADPALKLDNQLADRVEAGRDLCFAALEGDRLAAYGWYALDCIEGEHNFDVPMSYPADAAYMYNGFTHPDYRGLRLHGRVMGLALKSLKDQGVTRLVSTVTWTNQASLRSCDRLGYERLGRIATLGGANAVLLKTPPAARRKGVWFGRRAEKRHELPLAKPQRSMLAEAKESATPVGV